MLCHFDRSPRQRTQWRNLRLLFVGTNRRFLDSASLRSE